MVRRRARPGCPRTERAPNMASILARMGDEISVRHFVGHVAQRHVDLAALDEGLPAAPRASPKARNASPCRHRARSAVFSRAPVSPRYMPISPGRRGRTCFRRHRGKRPMPVSGMENVTVSSATRWLPCTETPAPPPITKAAQQRDIGLGEVLDGGVLADIRRGRIRRHRACRPCRCRRASGCRRRRRTPVRPHPG